MTPEEFLDWETEQPTRNEFIDGQIHPMPDSNLWHSEIGSNLLDALKSRSPRSHAVFKSQVKVRVGTNFLYPDVIVHRRSFDPHDQVLTEPVVLAEVLSPLAEPGNEHDKWVLYQRLPSLQTFMFLAQHDVLVEVYRRNGSSWIYTCHRDLDDVLELSEPALKIPVRELYAGIDGLDPAVPLGT
jgi:Uma2 family endonuclease